MSPARRIGLPPDGLDEAFPFHLVFAGAGAIRQVGRSIERLAPGLVGAALLDRYLCMAPPDIRSAADLLATGGQLVLLSDRIRPGLVMKGQVVRIDDGCAAFIGSPQAASAEALAALGVQLGDFAIHDPIADFLLLLQSQNLALAEAAQMAARLSDLNRELEERVATRTASLSAQAAELAQANQRLHDEASARQKMEAELHLAHQMEAVGQLAAGVAHEINTPIQFVGDNLRFLTDSFADIMDLIGIQQVAIAAAGDAAGAAGTAAASAVERAELAYLQREVPEALRQSLEGIDRVASLVRALKEFSHPEAGERKPADLNRAVEMTLAVARNEYKYVADVQTRLDPDLPLVACVVGEINQALLNLVVNAAHAIADAEAAGRGRGTITVSTRRDGDVVEIAVEDTGTGIPEAVQPRIFDPFFTTKPVGKGTGQGLYLVRTLIAKKHQGTVDFTTRIGEGTVFTMRLPIAPPAEPRP